MRVTRDKNCWCRTCGRAFHYPGIPNHRLGAPQQARGLHDHIHLRGHTYLQVQQVGRARLTANNNNNNNNNNTRPRGQGGFGSTGRN